MTKSEFEAMTKDELVEYADDRDIEVHHHWTKDEIIKEIMKAEKKAAKAEGREDKEDELEPEVQPVEAPHTKAADEPHPKIDPKLAALQEQAQKLPDPNTRFASTPTKDSENG